MSDMLVKLFSLPSPEPAVSALLEKGIRIKKALSPDRSKVVDFVRENFQQTYVDEVKCAFANNPVSCYIATRDKKIIGFACYDATARDFFGPTGVLESQRNQGVGRALLLKSLASMEEMGYAYAIIGWPAQSAIPFYEKCVGAVMIDDPGSGVYCRMAEIDE